jgi:phosphatidylserine/phosphatidylglycerophosphate/cardiolipin synthase-like enzyme
MGRYADAYFSPDRGADHVIIGFIDYCTTKLDIAIYSLTHDPIADAIIRAHQRGVPVRVLIDKTQAAGRYSDDEKMEAAGVEVRRDKVSGSMHNKFIIGDSRNGGLAVQTGSYNLTRNAAEENAENFVILRLQYMAKAYQEEFDRLWGLNAPD